MSGGKYHVVYEANARPAGVAKADLADGQGACDAIGVVSVLYGEDGSSEHAFFGLDGAGDRPLTPTEWFKAWSAMAAMLLRLDDLPEWQRRVARRAFDQIRMHVAQSS